MQPLVVTGTLSYRYYGAVVHKHCTYEARYSAHDDVWVPDSPV